MINEVWLPVAGFEEFYEVSDHGNIRSCDRVVNCSRGNSTRLWKGKVLSKIIGAKGYYQVSLSVEGVTHKVYVHRMVAETFLSERNETVNHKDGNKLNNHLSNLEWVTYSENNKHAFASGLKFPSGGRNGRTKNNS